MDAMEKNKNNLQTQVTQKGALLDEQGNVLTPGYAKKPVFVYDRAAIKAGKSRIKEWDYYCIANKEFALCLTVSDLGYLGALSVSVIDFVTPSQFSNTAISLFPLGKMNMPVSSEEGESKFETKKAKALFSVKDGVRRLTGEYHNADKFGTKLTFDITLDEEPEENMVIATPFKKKAHFYLNQKINCMRASGVFTLGEKECRFDPSDSLAVLDWGRGVWQYDNVWYWSSLNMRLDDGITFGWNLGYGFGDTTAASEDMLFYGGIANKIGRTKFEIPGESEGKPDFTGQWRIYSDDGRLDVTFDPIIDRYDPIDLKILCMIPHQVFGRFKGKCVLDNGKEIQVDAIGFAEKVHNKW